MFRFLSSRPFHIHATIFFISCFINEHLSSAFIIPNESTKHIHKTILQSSENSIFLGQRQSAHYLRSALPDNRINSFLSSSNIEENGNETLDDLLSEMHSKEFKFRIIVIGNGAILETTSILGPNYSSSISPKTNEKLITFSSNDKSFEFHLKPNHVSKVTFTTLEKPVGEDNKKLLRIIRFVKEDSSNMCSMILVDSSSDAVDWFESLLSRFGGELAI